MNIEELWEQGIPITYFVAGKFVNNFPPQYRSDVYSEARVALWKACKEYDDKKGAKFSTYVARVVKNWLSDTQKHFYRKKRHLFDGVVSLQQEVFDGVPILDTVPYHQDFVGHVMAKEILTIIDKIDPALRWRYIEGLPPQEIADRLGVTKKYVSDRLRKSRKKLRERLEEEGLIGSM